MYNFLYEYALDAPSLLVYWQNLYIIIISITIIIIFLEGPQL
jgi:hypothetical protein